MEVSAHGEETFERSSVGHLSTTKLLSTCDEAQHEPTDLGPKV
jgi:hypothetical protein